MRRRCPDLAKTQDMFPWVLQLEHILGASWHNGPDAGLTKENIVDTIEKLAGDLAEGMAKWLNDQIASSGVPEEEPEFAKWDDFLK